MLPLCLIAKSMMHFNCITPEGALLLSFFQLSCCIFPAFIVPARDWRTNQLHFFNMLNSFGCNWWSASMVCIVVASRQGYIWKASTNQSLKTLLIFGYAPLTLALASITLTKPSLHTIIMMRNANAFNHSVWIQSYKAKNQLLFQIKWTACKFYRLISLKLLEAKNHNLILTI